MINIKKDIYWAYCGVNSRWYCTLLFKTQNDEFTVTFLYIL